MAFNSCMHERNIYKIRPDFHKIAVNFPEFRKFAMHDEKGRIRVDLNDTEALRTLTKVLLKQDFNLEIEIPNGFLIPTVPQRLNYILWIEDLLTLLPNTSEPICGIDIGTGPCAIFSILGSQKNKWHFVSTETSDEAKQWAEKNLRNNDLQSLVKVVKVRKDSVLEEVMNSSSANYSFCLCNPPFFENVEEIKRKNHRIKETIDKIAKKEEIIFEGGEVSFVRKMISDSQIYRERISLYTSMFGKKKSFIQILKELQNIQDITYTKTQFCQGNTIRWGVAWTYLKTVDFEKIEIPKPIKNKKAKPPLIHSIPNITTDGCLTTVGKMSKKIKQVLHELEITSKSVKSAENYVEMMITTDKNTWSHQRRKRREMMKAKATDNCSNDCSKKDQSSPDLLALSSEQDTAKTSVVGSAENKSSNNLQSGSISKQSESVSEDSNADNSNLKSDISSQSSATVAPCIEESVMTSSHQKRKRSDCNDDDDSEANKKRLHVQDSSSKSQTSSAHVSRKRNLEDETVIVKGAKKHKGISSCSTELEKTSSFADDNVAESEESESTREHNDFLPKSLLYATLKLRKAEKHITFEMNCPLDHNRESMHQVFQYFKNKFS